MKPFRYERAQTTDAALTELRRGGHARYLAGGTNLVDLMKLGVETPDLLVDLGDLPLREIEPTPDGGLRIGALVGNSELAAHPGVRRDYPMLAQALLSGASGQLRNRATVGGNLLQRTRCVYFTDVSKPCNKRQPGSGCPARSGEHRNLAVLGASAACLATHPSDLAVALAALDAVVHVTDATGGAQAIPIGRFYRLPGQYPERDTTLPAGALITAVEVPAVPVAARSAYRKARDRASYAFAVGSVAAAVQVLDGTVEAVRIAWGAVAAAPWRAHAAEAALLGGPATAASFARAADAELGAAQPLAGNAYKIPLLKALTVQTLVELAGPVPA